MKRVAGLSISLLLAFFALSGVSAFAQTNIVILFSNSGNGILRSCYCPNAPWGGLAKRSWLANQIRNSAGASNVLLLDSGDFFPVENEPEKTACLMRLYSMMRYDAVAIGDQEIAYCTANPVLPGKRHPDEPTSPREEALAFPWLSGGYRFKDGARSGEFLAPPWMVKTVAGLRVGIVSVAGPDAYRLTDSRLTELSLTDPAEIVRMFVEQYREKTDSIIVLSHQGLDADRLLAKQLDGVDIIIGGHSQSLISPPEIVNGIAVCQAGKNGENLGLLMLAGTTTGFSAWRASGMQIRSNRQMAQAPAAGNANPFLPCTITTRRWLCSYQLIPLNTQIDEDPETASVIDSYYAGQDSLIKTSLTRPHGADQGQPVLVVENPVQEVIFRYGERKSVAVKIRNAGDAPLMIEKARSKIRWMNVVDSPKVIPPGGAGALILELTATNIDRFFRSEFSLVSNDKKRVVVIGTINGHVEGPMAGIADVSQILGGWFYPAGPSSPAEDMLAAPGQPPPADPGRPLTAGESSLTAGESSLIAVEFFYAAGCADCEETKKNVLPELKRRYGEVIELREYDIQTFSNYVHLARLQERTGIRTSESVSIYVNGQINLDGLKAIKERLFPEIEALRAIRTNTLSAGTKRRQSLDEQPSGENQPVSASNWEMLTRRFRSFSLWTIALAGLLDGVNPCAFATIIFFMTMLSVSKITGGRLLIVGISYGTASFVTYLALGFGAFHILKNLAAYQVIGDIVKWLMIVVLVFLSAISLKDAAMFRRTGRPGDVMLQLPAGIKRRIHEIMRNRLSARNIFAGSFVIGFLVTLLESVCTGQVYVPTLVFLTRHPEIGVRAWVLLVFYNIMFIIPLVVVTVAAYFGAKNQRLLEWSRGNVVWSKLLMCMFFAGLAVALIWL